MSGFVRKCGCSNEVVEDVRYLENEPYNRFTFEVCWRGDWLERLVRFSSELARWVFWGGSKGEDTFGPQIVKYILVSPFLQTSNPLTARLHLPTSLRLPPLVTPHVATTEGLHGHKTVRRTWIGLNWICLRWLRAIALHFRCAGRARPIP